MWYELSKKRAKIPLKEAPKEHYGFVYLITGPNGKIYVGKKAFYHSVRKKVSKREKKVTGTRKKTSVSTKDSGWLNYYGSSKELLADIKKVGKEKFERVILEYACNKTDLALKELEWQIRYDVLRVDSYNGWIGGKVFRKNLCINIST
jgi:hypothetical protein